MQNCAATYWSVYIDESHDLCVLYNTFMGWVGLMVLKKWSSCSVQLHLSSSGGIFYLFKTILNFIDLVSFTRPLIGL